MPAAYRLAPAGLVVALVALASPLVAGAADTFLPAEQAFRHRARLVAPDRAELLVDIAPGYYLYRAPLAVQAEGAMAGALDLPPGIVKYDENFQKEVETYHGHLRVGVPLLAVTGPVTLVVQSQGCAEAGLCYPLGTTRIRLDVAGASAMRSPAAAPDGAPAAAVREASVVPPGAEDREAQGAAVSRWLVGAGLGGLLGLLGIRWWRRRHQ